MIGCSTGSTARQALAPTPSHIHGLVFAALRPEIEFLESCGSAIYDISGGGEGVMEHSDGQNVSSSATSKGLGKLDNGGGRRRILTESAGLQELFVGGENR
ncbi:hypothetical protein V3C99_019025 [Haemonchus contortus]